MLHTAYHLLHLYGYPLITVMIALECAGLLVPGETVLLAASLFASHGHLNIYLVVTAAAIGALIGNMVGYYLGRLLGHTVLARHGRRVGLTPARLAVGRYLYALHGGKMVFLGRFGVILRSFSPLLAGANDMRLRPFFWWSLAGAIAWPSVHGFGAFLLGNAAKHISGPASIAFGITAAIGIALIIWFAHRNEHHLQAAARRWEAAQGPA
jgi:membrane protein DedA with SNARE-associated domain